MEQKEEIVTYYTATDIDYRVLWIGKDKQIHFGYYDTPHTSHARALLRMNALLAEAIDIKNNDRVLDAGCGFGGSAIWLSENIGCTVTGISLVPHHATAGNNFVTERNLQDEIQLLQGDYADLPFSNNTFSVYWALESIVHAVDRLRVFQEAFRVLASGGRLVITEYTLREQPPLTKGEYLYLDVGIKGWTMPFLQTPSQYKKQLETAGFTNIQIVDFTSHVSPSFRRLELLSWLMYPIAALIAPVFFKKKRLENYYGSRRMVQGFKKGLWRFSLITAQKP